MYYELDMSLILDVYPVLFVVTEVHGDQVKLFFKDKAGYRLHTGISGALPNNEEYRVITVSRDKIVGGQSVKRNMVVIPVRQEGFRSYHLRDEQDPNHLNLSKLRSQDSGFYYDIPGPNDQRGRLLDVGYITDPANHSKYLILNMSVNLDSPDQFQRDISLSAADQLFLRDNRQKGVNGKPMKINAIRARVLSWSGVLVSPEGDLLVSRMPDHSQQQREVRQKRFNPNKMAFEVDLMDLWVSRLDPFPLPPPSSDSEDYIRIGYVEFSVPPSSISVEKESNMEATPILRAAGTTKRMGAHIHSRWSLQAILSGDEINDVLVPLLRQIDRCPFLPVTNSVLNSLGIGAVSIESVQVATIPDSPNSVQLSLAGRSFMEHLLSAPLPYEWCINWPLFKVYTDYLPRFWPTDLPWNGKVSFLLPSYEYLQRKLEELRKDLSKTEMERTQDAKLRKDPQDESVDVPSYVFKDSGTGWADEVPFPNGQIYRAWIAPDVEIFRRSLAWCLEGNTPVPVAHRLIRSSEDSITIGWELSKQEIEDLLKMDRNAQEQERLMVVFGLPRDLPVEGVEIENLVQIYLGKARSVEGILNRIKTSSRPREPQISPNSVEWELPGIEWTQIAVSFNNNIVVVMGVSEVVAQQFMGRGDVVAVLKGVSDLQGVRRLYDMVELFRGLSFLFRGLGFLRDIHIHLRVRNELLQLMGFDSCMPVSLNVNSIPNFPEAYEIELQLVLFDPSQYEREYVQKLSPARSNIYTNIATTAVDRGDGYYSATPLTRAYESYGLNAKLETVETYPDLRLPTYKLLNQWMRTLAVVDKSSDPFAQKLRRSLLNIYEPDHLPIIAESFKKQISGINIAGKKKPAQLLPDRDVPVDPDFFCSTLGEGGSTLVSAVLGSSIPGSGKDYRMSNRYVAYSSDGAAMEVTSHSIDIKRLLPDVPNQYLTARRRLEEAHGLKEEQKKDIADLILRSRPFEDDYRVDVAAAEWETTRDLVTQDTPSITATSKVEVRGTWEEVASRIVDEIMDTSKSSSFTTNEGYSFVIPRGQKQRWFGDAVGQVTMSALNSQIFSLKAVVMAMLMVESGFQPVSVSNKGARGIAQLMPDTWREWVVDSTRRFVVSRIIYDPNEAPTLSIAVCAGKTIEIVRTLVKKIYDAENARNHSEAARYRKVLDTPELLIRYIAGVYNAGGAFSDAIVARLLGQVRDAPYRGLPIETTNHMEKVAANFNARFEHSEHPYAPESKKYTTVWLDTIRNDLLRYYVMEFRRGRPLTQNQVYNLAISEIYKKNKENSYKMPVKSIQEAAATIANEVIAKASELIAQDIIQAFIEKEIPPSDLDFLYGDGPRRVTEMDAEQRKQFEWRLREYIVGEPSPAVAKLVIQGLENWEKQGDLIASQMDEEVIPAGIEEHGIYMAGKNITPSGWNDEIKHFPRGRLLMCFPTYAVLLVMGGRWIRYWRFWDQWYGMFGIISIDVYKSRYSPTHVAELSISNMYNSLANTAADFSLQIGPIRAMQPTEWAEEEKYYDPGGPLIQFWRSIRAWLLPKIDEYERRVWDTEARALLVKPGMRLHIRMGYGGSAAKLPVVFNGTISNAESDDDILHVVALGDGQELEGPADPRAVPNEDNQVNYRYTGLFGLPVEPRQAIIRFFTRLNRESVPVMGPIVYTVSQGELLNANVYGINNFGLLGNAQLGLLPLVPTPGETGVNIYNSSPAGENYTGGTIAWVDFFTFGLAQNFTDGIHASFDIKARTIWEVINSIRMCMHDYIAAVEPFDLHSTLFVGKRTYPLYYTYKSPAEFGYDPNKMPKSAKDKAETKPSRYSDYMRYKQFCQYHVISSSDNLVKNAIQLNTEGLITDCSAADTSDIVGNRIELDPFIIPEDRKEVTVQSGINTPATSLLFLTPDFDPLNFLFRLRLLRPIGANLGIARPVRVVNNVARNVIREAMQEMYKGAISIVGNPTVKPYDICFLDDQSRLMEGPISVKEVEHHLSTQNGFVTSMAPDLLVTMMGDKDFVIVASAANAARELLTVLTVWRRIAAQKYNLTTGMMARGGMMFAADPNRVSRIRQMSQNVRNLFGGKIKPTAVDINDVQKFTNQVDSLLDAMREMGELSQAEVNELRQILMDERALLAAGNKGKHFASEVELRRWLTGVALRTLRRMTSQQQIGGMESMMYWARGFLSLSRDYVRRAMQAAVSEIFDLSRWQSGNYASAITTRLATVREVAEGEPLIQRTFNDPLWIRILNAIRFAVTPGHTRSPHRPLKETLFPIINLVLGTRLGVAGGARAAFGGILRKLLVVGTALDMMNRWLSAYYPCMLFPLHSEGKEFTAGIRGHSGSVVGDNPSFLQNILAFFNAENYFGTYKDIIGEGIAFYGMQFLYGLFSSVLHRELPAKYTDEQIKQIVDSIYRYDDIQFFTEGLEDLGQQLAVLPTGGVSNRLRSRIQDPSISDEERRYLSAVAESGLEDPLLVEYMRKRYDVASLLQLVHEYRRASVVSLESIKGQMTRGNMTAGTNGTLFQMETGIAGYGPGQMNLGPTAGLRSEGLNVFMNVLRQELDRQGLQHVRFYVASGTRPLWYQRLIYLSTYPNAKDAGDGLAFTQAEREAVRRLGIDTIGVAAPANPKNPSRHSLGKAVDLNFYKITVPADQGGPRYERLSIMSMRATINKALEETRRRGYNIVWLAEKDEVHFEDRTGGMR